MLLDDGADVNRQGGLRANALQAAVSSGSENLVLLLLEHVTDFNTQRECVTGSSS